MSLRRRERYNFSNSLPVPREPAPLPVERQATNVDNSNVGQLPQVIHYHAAPPDRTVQRLALGAGMGGGAVVTAVFLGPLLMGVLTAMIAFVVAMVLLVAVGGWVVVSVVKSVAAPRKGGAK